MSDTVPCKICGIGTPFKGTQLCTNCWEVTSRIKHFLSQGKLKAVDFLLDEIVIWKFGDKYIKEEGTEND